MNVFIFRDSSFSTGEPWQAPGTHLGGTVSHKAEEEHGKEDQQVLMSLEKMKTLLRVRQGDSPVRCDIDAANTPLQPRSEGCSTS